MESRFCDDNVTSGNPFSNPFLYEAERSPVGNLEHTSYPAILYHGERNDVETSPQQNPQQLIEQLCPQMQYPRQSMEQNVQEYPRPLIEQPCQQMSMEQNVQEYPRPLIEQPCQQMFSSTVGHIGENSVPVEPIHQLSSQIYPISGKENSERVVLSGCVGGVEQIQDSSVNVTNPFLRHGDILSTEMSSTPAVKERPEPMVNISTEISSTPAVKERPEPIFNDLGLDLESTMNQSTGFEYSKTGGALYRTPPPRRHSNRLVREPDRLCYKGGINAIIKANKIFFLSLMNDEWNEWMIYNGVEWLYIIINEWVLVTLNYVKNKINWRLFIEVRNNTIIYCDWPYFFVFFFF